jgi:hypothetical protein
MSKASKSCNEQLHTQKLSIGHYLVLLSDAYKPTPARSSIARYCRSGKASELPAVRGATFELGRWWLEVDPGLRRTEGWATGITDA